MTFKPMLRTYSEEMDGDTESFVLQYLSQFSIKILIL